MSTKEIAMAICGGDFQAKQELEKMMGRPMEDMTEEEKIIGLALISAFESQWRSEKCGHWTLNTDDFTPAHRCSVCGYNNPVILGDFGQKAAQLPMNYCPNCGAKMDL